MFDLKVIFYTYVYDHHIDGEMYTSHGPGPLFTRWLPDGSKDAIALDTGDENAILKVWFKRFGHKPDGSFIAYHDEKQEADSETIARQGKLDAGPLFGSLELKKVPDDTIDPVIKEILNDPRYEKLGKRIAKIISATVNHMLTVLRIYYGQYWLRDMDTWDSREMTIGNFCHRLGMKWSMDGDTWKDFLPDDDRTLRSVFSGISKSFAGFLTKGDWDNLGAIVSTAKPPSVAANLLHRCHKLQMIGDNRYALIEGISALEVAIDEYVGNRCGSLRNEVFNPKFEDMPKRGKLALIAYLVPSIPHADVEKAADAIKHRNEIVHDGVEIGQDVDELINAVKRVAAKLIDGPLFKFPYHRLGNRLSDPPEQGCGDE